MKTKLVLKLSFLLAGLFTGCSSTKNVSVAHGDSLTQAWAILSNKRFVDLTHSFSPSTPVWTGFGQAHFSAAADPATGRPYTIEKDGFRATQYALVGQYGTHIDPPAHFDAHGKTPDQLPVKDMILRLVVFDLTPKLHLFSAPDIIPGI